MINQKLKARIANALQLSNVLSMPFNGNDEQKNNELHYIAKELRCGANTIRTGNRYDVVIIDANKEIELL